LDLPRAFSISAESARNNLGRGGLASSLHDFILFCQMLNGKGENMKKMYLIIAMAVLFSLIVCDRATATVPYQLSILSPFQTSTPRESIKGIRYNFIYGSSEDVTGLDFGFFNHVAGDQIGLQFGIFNSSFKTSGVQIGIINKTEYLNGLQIGILNIHNEGYLKFLPIVNFSF